MLEPMPPLALQLARHPSLKAIEREAMYRLHPSKYDAHGNRYVPAVHYAPAGPSVFMYPMNGRYANKMLADGRTIEYHPSTMRSTNADLDSLVGQEVTLYVQCDKQQCRQGRVTVKRAPQGAFHLALVSPPLPAAPGPSDRISWADME